MFPEVVEYRIDHRLGSRRCFDIDQERLGFNAIADDLELVFALCQFPGYRESPFSVTAGERIPDQPKLVVDLNRKVWLGGTAQLWGFVISGAAIDDIAVFPEVVEHRLDHRLGSRRCFDIDQERLGFNAIADDLELVLALGQLPGFESPFAIIIGVRIPDQPKLIVDLNLSVRLGSASQGWGIVISGAAISDQTVFPVVVEYRLDPRLGSRRCFDIDQERFGFNAFTYDLELVFALYQFAGYRESPCSVMTGERITDQPILVVDLNLSVRLCATAQGGGGVIRSCTAFYDVVSTNVVVY